MTAADRRRDLAGANIAAAVERALATAPPLTDDQAERIANILAPERHQFQPPPPPPPVAVDPNEAAARRVIRAAEECAICGVHTSVHADRVEHGFVWRSTAEVLAAAGPNPD